MSVPLLAELKRRRVFRALVGYGIVAFAVLQIIEPVMHGLHWPDGVLSYVVVALAVGFPIVVALAWIFDVRGGHIERTSGGRLGARRGLLLACISAVAAAPGLIWYFGFRGTARTPAAPPSIVVLPFVNMSGDKENEYFSDGMTEEIINALANVEGLRVVARTSAFSFKGKNVDVRRIGEDLNVATVLEGSVRRQGNQLRVAAQLISLPDGYHLWSKTYERELNNVFAVEDEVARAIVQALAPKLLPGLALAQATTVNTEAHDLYLRGRYFWNQRTREALTKAQSLFEQAIALDAGYALAYSGLSDCYNLLVDYGGGRAADLLPKAKKAALKALELDGASAEAHASLGAILQHEYDWAGSNREFRRAIELRPGYVSAHHWYALNCLAQGRFAEARSEIERARQLDPTSVFINGAVAVMLNTSREYDLAIVQAFRTLDLDPNYNLGTGFPGLRLSADGQGSRRARGARQGLAILAPVTGRPRVGPGRDGIPGRRAGTAVEPGKQLRRRPRLPADAGPRSRKVGRCQRCVPLARRGGREQGLIRTPANGGSALGSHSLRLSLRRVGQTTES